MLITTAAIFFFKGNESVTWLDKHKRHTSSSCCVSLKTTSFRLWKWHCLVWECVRVFVCEARWNFDFCCCFVFLIYLLFVSLNYPVSLWHRCSLFFCQLRGTCTVNHWVFFPRVWLTVKHYFYFRNFQTEAEYLSTQFVRFSVRLPPQVLLPTDNNAHKRSADTARNVQVL